MKLVKDIDNNQNSKKISDKEAEEAFKTIPMSIWEITLNECSLKLYFNPTI